MRAGLGRTLRRLALVIPLCLTVFWLGSGLQTGARAEQPAAGASSIDAAALTTFMPVVSGFPPPHVELVPFAIGFDTDTITDIANAGDERLFVVQREGLIRIVWPDGTIQPEPFVDLTHDVATINWEAGLLGLAFHPDYPAAPYFYVFYTDLRNIRVARLTVDPQNANQAIKNSMRFLMIIPKSVWGGQSSPVHNAGDLTFGPDGYLYIPIGDGGPDPYIATKQPGDPLNNAQRRDTALGSILRIDVNENGLRRPDCGIEDYTIPPDNPYIGDTGCDEIWATGLRNPWRIDFDPANGDLYIADVGEWQREEIDVLPAGTGAGANLGWHCYEGTVNYKELWDPIQFEGQFRNCGPREDYVFPAYEFDHSNGICSMTGGVVYRGQAYPYFSGTYLYSDFCTGRIWALEQTPAGQWQSRLAGQTQFPISTYGRDVHGEVYAGMRDPKGLTNGDVTLFKVAVK